MPSIPIENSNILNTQWEGCVYVYQDVQVVHLLQFSKINFKNIKGSITYVSMSRAVICGNRPAQGFGSLS